MTDQNKKQNDDLKKTKQHDPNKYPIFDGTSASLDTWEKMAKLYLRRQNDSQWTLERNDARRNATLAANNWTAAQQLEDQWKAWDLLYTTFEPYKQTILNAANEGVGTWATDAWKHIYAEYLGDANIEIADLDTELRDAKVFHG